MFGLVVCAQTVRFAANGWIASQWTEPAFHFTWVGFDGVAPLAGDGMVVVVVAQACFALALALGWHTRAMALAFAATFTWGELIDKALYLNHYYLVSLLAVLCAALPVGATWSLDARRRGARLVPREAYHLLRVQLACVYVFAGLAKLSPDWLFAGEPLRTWLQAERDRWLIGPLLDTPAAALALSWLGMLHDLAIVPLVLLRRTRAVATVIAVGFHGAIALLFPVGMFSFIMLATLTVCFDPSWPRRLLARVSARLGRADDPPPPPAARIRTSLARAAAAAWIAVQVLVPLRHLAYPGDVDWTEEGFRFAWRVMLIEKVGQVEFTVVTAEPSGRFEHRQPEDLTPLQAKMMSTQPDMILDYAHHLAARYRARGYRGVAVYSRAYCSLNGRPAEPLIDPQVDLAAEPRDLGPKRWIVPRAPDP